MYDITNRDSYDGAKLWMCDILMSQLVDDA